MTAKEQREIAKAIRNKITRHTNKSQQRTLKILEYAHVATGTGGDLIFKVPAKVGELLKKKNPLLVELGDWEHKRPLDFKSDEPHKGHGLENRIFFLEEIFWDENQVQLLLAEESVSWAERRTSRGVLFHHGEAHKYYAQITCENKETGCFYIIKVYSRVKNKEVSLQEVDAGMESTMLRAREKAAEMITCQKAMDSKRKTVPITRGQCDDPFSNFFPETLVSYERRYGSSAGDRLT